MQHKSPRFRIADSVHQHWLIHEYSEAEYGPPLEVVEKLLALEPGADAVLDAPTSGGRHVLAGRVCGYGWRMVGLKNADEGWEVVHLLIRV
jgi:hypothetical protein